MAQGVTPSGSCHCGWCKGPDPASPGDVVHPLSSTASTWPGGCLRGTVTPTKTPTAGMEDVGHRVKASPAWSHEVLEVAAWLLLLPPRCPPAARQIQHLARLVRRIPCPRGLVVATAWWPDGERLQELRRRWWWPWRGGLMESISRSRDTGARLRWRHRAMEDVVRSRCHFLVTFWVWRTEASPGTSWALYFPPSLGASA